MRAHERMRVRVLTDQQQREARIFNNIHNPFHHTKDAVTAFHTDPLIEESLKPGLLKKTL